MRAVLLISLLSACACAGAPEERPTQEKVAVERDPLADVIGRHAGSLVSIAGVQAVYESVDASGSPCVKIAVDRLTEELRAALPSELGGWPVVVEESGTIRPLGSD